VKEQTQPCVMLLRWLFVVYFCILHASATRLPRWSLENCVAVSTILRIPTSFYCSLFPAST